MSETIKTSEELAEFLIVKGINTPEKELIEIIEMYWEEEFIGIVPQNAR